MHNDISENEIMTKHRFSEAARNQGAYWFVLNDSNHYKRIHIMIGTLSVCLVFYWRLLELILGY